MRLDDNHIEGQIPPSFGNLKELERLVLSNNFLNGPVPAELGNLPQLDELDLSENSFSNELPSTFINIGNETTERKSINLENNRFEGDISALSEIPRLGKFFFSRHWYLTPLKEDVYICSMHSCPFYFCWSLNRGTSAAI